MSAVQLDRAAVLTVLNRILEVELAGVVRYTHYSLMVFGHNRIPIVSWLRAQSNERDKSVFMEEYARRMIYQEEMHCGEVDKMLRAPGEVKQFSEPPMS